MKNGCVSFPTPQIEGLAADCGALMLRSAHSGNVGPDAHSQKTRYLKSESKEGKSTTELGLAC